MKLKTLTQLGLAASFFLMISPQSEGAGDMDKDHLLSISGGISSPSRTTAITENPAGLIYNSDTKFLAEAASPNSSLSPMGVGGLFYLGNGSVGAGIGLETFTGGRAYTGSQTILNFGLAAEVKNLNLSFGLAGGYLLSQSGASGWGENGKVGLNLGMIYNPNGQYRLGITTYQILNGIDAVGAGLAADLNNSATIALDAAMNPDSKDTTLKPGIGIRLAKFQLSYGYGFKVNGGGAWLTQGSTLGLGLELSTTFHLQAYYNQRALYYAGLTIRM